MTAGGSYWSSYRKNTPHPSAHLTCLSLQGAGILPVEKHRWLGCDASQLACNLAQADLPKQACLVAEISCQELTLWCHSDPKNALLFSQEVMHHVVCGGFGLLNIHS